MTSQGGSAAPQWATPSAGAWTVLSHDNFSTTNATNSESRGWTSDYTQIKCVFNYLSCGDGSGQYLAMQFYLDNSLGTQGTLNATGNSYRYTGFPLRFQSNSNNLWYYNQSHMWPFAQQDNSTYWSGELTFPMPTGVGADGTTYKHVWGIVTRQQDSDRVACEHEPDSASKFIVGAKLYNISGNSWTEGRSSWYGLKRS